MTPCLVGLLITKDDQYVFGDWCNSQLDNYDAVVCLDGSRDGLTKRIAAEFPNKLVYLHEQQLSIAHRTDHGLRSVVHHEIIRRFGYDNWIMCCHADEFCYHDPRKIAAKAEDQGFDLVSWLCPHFYPHPSEWPPPSDLQRRPIYDQFRHFHWGYLDSEFPWMEDRLYRNSPTVQWDGITQGSVRPHGIRNPATLYPTLQHYKVLSLNLENWEQADGTTLHANHWTDQGKFRTGLPFAVRHPRDFFVDKIPRYQHCSRFDGSFPFTWNLGDDFRTDRTESTECLEEEFREAARLTSLELYDEAEGVLESIRIRSRSGATKSIVSANLGVIQTLQGKVGDGQLSFQSALALDRSNSVAAENLALLMDVARYTESQKGQAALIKNAARSGSLGRIAILSHLFNWPSTGGGTIHTKELAEFLQSAGFDVLHVFARYSTWGIGRCDEKLNVPTHVLAFDDSSWSLENVVAAFRSATESFRPDHIIITDSWNFKPWLAQAAAEVPYVLRYQALENLCPLNNVRLLPSKDGNARQCGRHQLATPSICRSCCQDNEEYSGHLHRLDRGFSRVGSEEYDLQLRKAITGAEAVLVVNPLMQAMMSPWNDRTLVVPAGMDPHRFETEPEREARSGATVVRLLFAGLVQEYMKGFHVLQRACDELYSRRRDFELVVTAEAQNGFAEYIRPVGWLNQQDLARELLSTDILVFPTIAQEALGRTAVEAMAAGVPVVASRIGGLPYTVADGVTGLLATPGDAHDLGCKIETLLDSDSLRRGLGANGQRRFRDEYSWAGIVERHYKPLLAKRSNLI